MPSMEQVNYFELIYMFILIFCQYLCLALILMERQIHCQIWPQGNSFGLNERCGGLFVVVLACVNISLYPQETHHQSL